MYIYLNNNFKISLSSFSGPEIPVGPQPNTALWSTILTLATFTIAYYLRIFRNGKFLGRSVSVLHQIEQKLYHEIHG